MVLIVTISAVKVTLRFTFSQNLHLVLGPTWDLWADFGLYGTSLVRPL